MTYEVVNRSHVRSATPDPETSHSPSFCKQQKINQSLQIFSEAMPPSSPSLVQCEVHSSDKKLTGSVSSLT